MSRIFLFNSHFFPLLFLCFQFVSGTQAHVIITHDNDDDWDDDAHWKIRIIVGSVVAGVTLIIAIIALFMYRHRKQARLKMLGGMVSEYPTTAANGVAPMYMASEAKYTSAPLPLVSQIPPPPPSHIV
ncbi:hypothetical protein B0H19DRAFT_1366634, partial [Mycena capillaripes]